MSHFLVRSDSYKSFEWMILFIYALCLREIVIIIKSIINGSDNGRTSKYSPLSHILIIIQKQMTDDTFDCPVCFGVMAEPVVTPCQHRFCYICISQTLERNNFACPMCRAPFEEQYIPDIDQQFQEKVAAGRPDEFEKASQALKENGLWRGNLQSIKFFFGNKHRLLSDEETGEENSNTHEWTGFVECADPSLSKKFIASVEYKLHPTFKPSKVKVTKTPLEIKRWGWGVFEIKIIINWKKWMNREPVKYTHMLSFDGDGKRNAFLVDVPKEDYQKAFSK